MLTSSGRLDEPGQRERLLGSVAHEFFHAWNAERIRPRSLEPFDFTDANILGDLWLAEGFTNYYGKLVTIRAGLRSLSGMLQELGTTLDTVIASRGRQLNSAVEISRLAPFTDAGTAIDRTNFDNTYISYYTWGEAIALGLDLTLRVRTMGRVPLDSLHAGTVVTIRKTAWRIAWSRRATVHVGRRSRCSWRCDGCVRFAVDFFGRFIEGHDVMDYSDLLARAGAGLAGARAPGPGRRWAQPTPYGSPLYVAGVDRDDVLTMLDGRSVSSVCDLAATLERLRPGDVVTVGCQRRGVSNESTVTLIEDPGVELVTLGRLSSEQVTFRDAWLGSRQ